MSVDKLAATGSRPDGGVGVVPPRPESTPHKPRHLRDPNGSPLRMLACVRPGRAERCRSLPPHPGARRVPLWPVLLPVLPTE